MLSCSLKTAWFLTHRIREAMRDGSLAPMGGTGQIVEIDETFIGKKEGAEVRRGAGHKNVVLTLVERGGRARSFHVENVTKEAILPIVRAHVAKESHVMTDEASRYAKLGNEFTKHDSVDHSRQEYAYRDRKTGVTVSTNSVEGSYGVFKPGMVGVYSIAASGISTDIYASSISGIPIGSRLALTIPRAPTAPCLASKASGSPMKRLRKVKGPNRRKWE